MEHARLYPIIAKWIADNYIISSDPVRFVLKDMVDQLCQKFEAVDEDFMRETFIKYCKLEEHHYGY
jgi:hypothetical protein